MDCRRGQGGKLMFLEVPQKSPLGAGDPGRDETGVIRAFTKSLFQLGKQILRKSL